jgi:hypothetical protein
MGSVYECQPDPGFSRYELDQDPGGALNPWVGSSIKELVWRKARRQIDGLDSFSEIAARIGDLIKPKMAHLAIGGPKEIRAVVLDTFTIDDADAASLMLDPELAPNEDKDAPQAANTLLNMVACYARIPELHCMIPVPAWGDKKDPECSAEEWDTCCRLRSSQIENHSIFYAPKQLDVSGLAPYSIIRVSFPFGTIKYGMIVEVNPPTVEATSATDAREQSSAAAIEGPVTQEASLLEETGPSEPCKPTPAQIDAEIKSIKEGPGTLSPLVNSNMEIRGPTGIKADHDQLLIGEGLTVWTYLFDEWRQMECTKAEISMTTEDLNKEPEPLTEAPNCTGEAHGGHGGFVEKLHDPTYAGTERATEKAPLIVQPITGIIGAHYYTDRSGHNHGAWDIAAPVGTPVHAMTKGKVVAINDPSTPARGGGSVTIEYLDTSGIRYRQFNGHLSVVPSDLKIGSIVEAGQVIALTGNTGNSTGPHLHTSFTQGGLGSNWEKMDEAAISEAFGFDWNKGQQMVANSTCPDLIVEKREYQHVETEEVGQYLPGAGYYDSQPLEDPEGGAE